MDVLIGVLACIGVAFLGWVILVPFAKWCDKMDNLPIDKRSKKS